MNRNVKVQDLMTREEAAEYLGLKKETLTSWVRTNQFKLPIYRINGKVMYDVNDLNKIITWQDKKRERNSRYAHGAYRRYNNV